MEKVHFEKILNTYIYPLLPKFESKQLIDCNLANVSKYINYDSTTNKVTIYPQKHNPTYAVELQISNPFEIKAAEFILNSIISAYDKMVMRLNGEKTQIEYSSSIFKTAYELGICDYLGLKDYYKIIEILKYWSQKTYEGKRVVLALYVTSDKNSPEGPNYLTFLKNTYSAVITNPEKSAVVINRNGILTDYITFDKKTKHNNLSGKETEKNALKEEQGENIKQLVPSFLENFAKEAVENKVGFVLLNSGDILIIKNARLSFAYRSGEWTFFDTNLYFSQIYNAIMDPTDSENVMKSKIMLSKSICESILDVSFSHTGGCIGVIKERDFFSNDYCKTDALEKTGEESHSDPNSDRAQKIELKKSVIKKMVVYEQGIPFSSISRLTREELLAMDGALCIDLQGKILCASSIVKVGSGSEGGGRTQAAQTLAEVGKCLGIKISEDGNVECYQYDSIDKFKILFSTH